VNVNIIKRIFFKYLQTIKRKGKKREKILFLSFSVRGLSQEANKIGETRSGFNSYFQKYKGISHQKWQNVKYMYMQTQHSSIKTNESKL
jgi:hypothetical protein